MNLLKIEIGILFPALSPSRTNVISGKWLFRHKFKADGSLERNKARLVACGFRHEPGVDFDETFSHVVKLSTVHAVLSLVVSCYWPIYQLDVTNAFQHGTLSELFFCEQPSGFVDP